MLSATVAQLLAIAGNSSAEPNFMLHFPFSIVRGSGDISPSKPAPYRWASLFAIVLAMALAGCSGYVPGRQWSWDAKVKEMCEKDGGTKIFEVVELPKQQYELLLNKFGTLEIPLEGAGAINAPLVRKEEHVSIRDGNPAVWRHEMVIIRKSDRGMLGRQITYSRVGGDFPSPAHTSSFSCPEKRVNLFATVVKQREE